jgi:hypothetical protein
LTKIVAGGEPTRDPGIPNPASNVRRSRIDAAHPFLAARIQPSPRIRIVRRRFRPGIAAVVAATVQAMTGSLQHLIVGRDASQCAR